MASDGSPTPPLRGSEPPDASITSGALARRLGISPTTLRSWDQRYSLGPAQRRRGHHRRWSPQDVAMVEEMCSLTASGISPAEAARSAKKRAHAAAPQGQGERPVLPRSATATRTSGKAGSRGSPGLPLGAVRAECRGLARAALRLESVAIQEQLNTFVQEHGVVAAWEELMMPTLHAVGRKWETSGDRYVEVEHLLSWHVSTALRNAQLLLGLGETRKGSPPVLLACVPGEQHTLPLEAVHAALLQRSRPVRMLGAAVPAEALIAAVLRTGPAAVVLWSQTRSLASTPLALHLLGMGWGVSGARQQAALVLAGPGWRGARIEGAVQPQGLREAMALLAPESSDLSE
ncbi:MerR family transcriptional regulator [Streptomyces sp. NPDC058293]|uniref:MerR family transcriptional regulator n=1 Tax=Streptomyces sp. NPDC058293 TaxID=3346429 RepID=UPI0036E72CA4